MMKLQKLQPGSAGFKAAHPRMALRSCPRPSPLIGAMAMARPPMRPMLRRAVCAATTGIDAHPAPATSPTPPAFPNAPLGEVLTLEHASSEVIMAVTGPSTLIPTPSMKSAGSLDLQPLDNMFRNFGYTGWGFVYPGRLDVPAAKEALAHLLQLYPVLAGQLDRRRGSAALGVRWDLAVRGLEVITATSPLCAEQLMPQRGQYTAQGRLAVQACPDMAVLDEALPANADQLLDEGGPLARISIVHLAPSPSNPTAPGGSLLCVHAHHAIFDGGSLRRTLEDWAALTRAIVTGDPSGISGRDAPVFGRHSWDELAAHARAQGYASEPNPQHFVLDVFWPPAGQPAPTPAGEGPYNVVPTRPTTHDFNGSRGRAAYGGPFTPAVWVHFSAEHIAALKAQAMLDLESEHAADPSGKPQFVSSNDVVSARMWQLMAQLPSYSRDAKSRFLRVTDYRSRLGAPQHSAHHHTAAAGRHSPTPTPEHPTIPKNAVGNWVGFTASHELPVAQSSLGTLAAELRSNLGAGYSKAQAFLTFAWMQHHDDQGEAGRCWLSKTSMWAPQDSDVASTSWDVAATTLDFGSGQPVWLQRTVPTFIQNHLIVVTDMMNDEGSLRSRASSMSSTEGVSDVEARTKGRGLWVALGLTPPDMEAFVREGVQELPM